MGTSGARLALCPAGGHALAYRRAAAAFAFAFFHLGAAAVAWLPREALRPLILALLWPAPPMSGNVRIWVKSIDPCTRERANWLLRPDWVPPSASTMVSSAPVRGVSSSSCSCAASDLIFPCLGGGQVVNVATNLAALAAFFVPTGIGCRCSLAMALCNGAGSLVGTASRCAGQRLRSAGVSRSGWRPHRPIRVGYVSRFSLCGIGRYSIRIRIPIKQIVRVSHREFVKTPFPVPLWAFSTAAAVLAACQTTGRGANPADANNPSPTAGSSTSQQANAMARQGDVQPIEYQCQQRALTIIVIPGRSRAAMLRFTRQFGPNNIADYAELNWARPFCCAERADLGPLLNEFTLACHQRQSAKGLQGPPEREVVKTTVGL